MPTQQGGQWRRKNGKLEQVTKPAEEQRYGAHAVHPSDVKDSKRTAEAPKPATAEAPSSAKTKAPVKGDSDANTTT